MASSKLQSAMEHQGDDAKMDMSPMIDMVFLLLIFFMVASRMVTVKVDDKIKPPVADESIRPDNVKGRIIFNIRSDGTFTAGDGKVTVTEDEITERSTTWVERFKDTETGVLQQPGRVTAGVLVFLMKMRPPTSYH